HSQVVVTFSEVMDPATAATGSRYAIDHGINVINATLSADGKTVTLNTSAIEIGNTYTLTITGVKDLSGHNQFTGAVPIALLEARTAANDGNGNYTVVVEGEDYDANVTTGVPRWTFGSAFAGFTGTGYMESLPDA